jgi:hypothetical protein
MRDQVWRYAPLRHHVEQVQRVLQLAPPAVAPEEGVVCHHVRLEPLLLQLLKELLRTLGILPSTERGDEDVERAGIRPHPGARHGRARDPELIESANAGECSEEDVERVAQAGVSKESLDEKARNGGVRRNRGSAEERGERVVARVEAEEVGERVEGVGELVGGSERLREEREVRRRGQQRWGEREEEAEGGERVGVARAEHDGGELVVAEERE